jgi:hypothetical protein
MHTLHLAAVHARYCLPARSVDERRRLDAALEGMLGRALAPEVERSLAEAGVPAGAQVCIRSLDVPLRLRLSAPTVTVSLAWSRAIGLAIRERIKAGGPGVVRYSSRTDALLDMASCVAVGDRRRAWAWRQLGWWRGRLEASDQQAGEELLRVLLGDPPTIVPVLATLAHRGVLAALTRVVPGPAWRVLAEAALAAAGAHPSLGGTGPIETGWPQQAPQGGPPRDPGAGREVRQATGSRAARIVAASALATAAAAAPRRFLGDPQARWATAALVVLEADPALVTGPVADELLHAVGNALGDATSPAAAAATAAAAPAAEPASASPTGAVPFGREASPGGAVVPLAAGVQAPEPPAGSSRRVGRTRFGGLPFLLHVVDALGVPAQIAASPVLAGRTARWALHRLAVALAPMDPADPAALAFAGLGPGTRPPSAEDAPPTDAEAGEVAELAEQVGAALGERLGRSHESVATVMDFVCRRDAEVLADPGWIELHLRAEDVSVEVRRAGLDLDPGYVPWLGVVVRFVYG